MQCPYCAHEMDAGVLQSMNDITWLPRPVVIKKPTWARDAKPLVMRKNPKLPIGVPYAETFRCPACACIVVKQHS